MRGLSEPPDCPTGCRTLSVPLVTPPLVVSGAELARLSPAPSSRSEWSGSAPRPSSKGLKAPSVKVSCQSSVLQVVSTISTVGKSSVKLWALRARPMAGLGDQAPSVACRTPCTTSCPPPATLLPAGSFIVTEYAPGHRPSGTVAPSEVLEATVTFVSASPPMASVMPSENPTPVIARALSRSLRTIGGLTAITLMATGVVTGEG